MVRISWLMTDSLFSDEKMNSKFFQNIFKLSSAPLITQVISLFLLPVITRLYSPTDFGHLNIYASTVGVIAVLAGFGYHQAIVLPDNDNKAYSLAFISIIISIGLSISVLGILTFLPEVLARKYNLHYLLKYKYYLSAGVFFHGTYVTFLGLAVRHQNFGMISIGRVVRVAITKGLVIILALLFTATLTNLIIAEVLSTLVVSLILFWPHSNRITAHFLKRNQVKYLLVRYKQFPLYNIPSDLLFRTKQFLLFYFASSYFDVQSAGLLGMAVLITSLPITFISGSVGEVLYGEYARDKNDRREKSGARSLQVVSILAFLGVFVFGFLILFGEEILVIILGEKWQGTGTVIAALGMAMVGEFIFTPFLNLTKIFDKQYWLIIYQFFGLFAIISGFLSFNLFNGGLYSALSIYSFLMLTGTLTIAIKTLSMVSIRPNVILQVLLKATVINAVPLSTLYYLSVRFQLNPVASIIFGVLFFCITIMTRMKYDKKFQNMVLKELY